jgi:hypothetical protein
LPRELDRTFATRPDGQISQNDWRTSVPLAGEFRSFAQA